VKKIITKYFELLLIPLVSLLTVLTVSCGKEVSRSPVEPPPPEGFIYVNSIPERFTIFVNDRNTGRLTPDSISYIAAGDYKITLKKKYFKDTSIVASLNEDEKLSVNIDIISNPSMYGKLYLQSNPPGASITLNDSVLNQTTPLTITNLFPGEYSVKFSLYNHRDRAFTAVVESSQRNDYVRDLRDTSVWVDYQVSNSTIPSNTLYSIAIDDNNIKWIGTRTIGLLRYDENNFIPYNTSNSLIPSNWINCITIDDQNRIWVGTDNGIGIFDGNSWIVYNSGNSGLFKNYVNIIRFYNNVVWIGTAGGLFKFDGINWSAYEHPKDKDWINDIYVENENKLWLGTKLDGIFTFENETYTWVRWWDYHYCTMTINSIEKDQSNEVWYCFSPDTIGRTGISRWDGSSFTNMYIGTFRNIVKNIVIDNQNNKWVSTSEGFFAYDNQNNSSFFNITNSLISSDNVSASAVDSKGHVWITTEGGGLNKYKPPQ